MDWNCKNKRVIFGFLAELFETSKKNIRQRMRRQDVKDFGEFIKKNIHKVK